MAPRSPLPAARNSSAGVSPAVRAASSPPSPSTKFLFRRRLLGPNATSSNLGSKITFTFHGSPRHPPQHRDLPNVRQRIRDRPLKQFFGQCSEWLARSEEIVERLQPRKEPFHILIP